MAEHGIEIGVALIVVVISVAVGLAYKAQGSVTRFRDEHHTPFDGRKES